MHNYNKQEMDRLYRTVFSSLDLRPTVNIGCLCRSGPPATRHPQWPSARIPETFFALFSSEFLKDSQKKRRLALEKFQGALRNRETTISCLASAIYTPLFTITYLMGVALSSDLFLCSPYCELYSS